MAEIAPSDLIPFSAMCCNVNSLYFKVPDMYGGQGSSEYCCFANEWVMCKPGENEGEIMVLNKGRCALVHPKVCCKGKSQCFCCVSKMSLPLDPEIPIMFTMCGITCMYDKKPLVKVFAKLSDFGAPASA